jgi:electron transport complex protein RnfB
MKNIDRRKFLIKSGRALSSIILGGIAYRIVGTHLSKEDVGPKSRYIWQINPDKCTFCGKCETLCIKTPSAVKAVNDQKKCSFCVVCHGHIKETGVASDKIMEEGIRICEHDAVTRKAHSGGVNGYFIYDIDDEKCVACGKCAKLCNEKGTQSMFLIIRPEFCLNCNSCEIAKHCPEGAIEKLYIAEEDDFRGEYELEG